MNCPGCNRENPLNSSFCRFCGATLRAGATQQTQQGYVDGKRQSAPFRDSTHATWERSDWGYPGWDINSMVEGAIERVKSMFHGLTEKTDVDENLAHGQVVIVAAHWMLVITGLMLALWNPGALGELQVSILLILSLAVANFFLHARILMGRPIPAQLAYAASTADIAVISLVLIAGGGFNTIPFVFYFPALLALSVAFPSNTTALFTAATVASYGFISMATAGPGAAPTIVTQMVMFVGVAACGNVYWRVEGDRRRVAMGTEESQEWEAREEVATH